ncbi:bifunctional phosphatase PAP2/diacylglycerol kinase family protein [Actinoalloteichus sp. GBA129-24]|uniref:bifunctional phosphatase PAP2/diacylglycerol kinase family protein n=1 Tax=Actinoalloteichus sp. GBA129-24 TaxID=1612551 RepID=UPI000950A209|nr:bifunctional phosphatase PAP2/diacylglycerol kinase family protein [Actinoalloteichus sp. GBA129-24]APU20606.1 sphingosine/diacylglycerol kinase-like enzyme [Actinoalloteichus sp. GBA129-24]
MKELGTAANHSLLWFTAASVLALRKGPTRRAAWRGLAAIAGASALANAVGKPLFPRRRPAVELVPESRRYRNPPRSSSFPSGHAASAAAFATAVAMESPRTARVVAPLAAAVAFSRVHTGVHWPSDVLGGALLGAAVAGATRRWWPVPEEVYDGPGVEVDLPPLSDGAGLVLLINPGSGLEGEDAGEQIAQAWPAATVVYPKEGVDLIDQFAEIVDGLGSAVRAVGVSGGDGTVAAVAAVAAVRKLPLLVIPGGTLNHFARDIRVDGPTAATMAAEHGTGIEVDLGSVEIDGRIERWFLNTASLGGYPDLVGYRERWEDRYGKWPAAAAALVRVLRESRPLTVRIDGRVRQVWLLFVGNGVYTPRGFAPMIRGGLHHGTLDVRYVRADVRFSRLRFVLAAVTGALHHSRTYVQRECAELVVQVAGDPVIAATDGEVGPAGRRFRFAAHCGTLRVYRPRLSRVEP